MQDNKSVSLISAVERLDFDSVSFLLKSGADPNCRDTDGCPVLWNLQYRGDSPKADNIILKIAQLLLDSGADPNIEYENDSLFEYATEKVFNNFDDDWEHLSHFFVLLIAYGGYSGYCVPKIIKPIDTCNVEEYTLKLFYHDDMYHIYGKIVDKYDTVYAEI